MSVRIAILVEGATERAFVPALRCFLRPRVGSMPKLDVVPYDGRIPKQDKLKREVGLLLGGQPPANAVIALTDVYTGSRDFRTAEEAKAKMSEWVGQEPRFHPHVALHDFEAWLLPYWDDIQKLAGSTRKLPRTHPENVNHGKPPAMVLAEIFRTGSTRRSYSKTRDAVRILRGKDLSVSAEACPELASLLNTILKLAGAEKTALI